MYLLRISCQIGSHRSTTEFAQARSELEQIPPAGGTVEFPLIRGIDYALGRALDEL